MKHWMRHFINETFPPEWVTSWASCDESRRVSTYVFVYFLYVNIRVHMWYTHIYVCIRMWYAHIYVMGYTHICMSIYIVYTYIYVCTCGIHIDICVYVKGVTSNCLESCHICAMTQLSHVKDESCLIWMSHITYERCAMSHVKHESCLIWMSHATYERWVMSHVKDESCHI